MLHRTELKITNDSLSDCLNGFLNSSAAWLFGIGNSYAK
jgi:hypothetical protein